MKDEQEQLSPEAREAIRDFIIRVLTVPAIVVSALSFALGFFINGYGFGRRFLTRGSYRPGRSGLTTNSGISSPSSAPRSHRSASMKRV